MLCQSVPILGTGSPQKIVSLYKDRIQTHINLLRASISSFNTNRTNLFGDREILSAALGARDNIRHFDVSFSDKLSFMARPITARVSDNTVYGDILQNRNLLRSSASESVEYTITWHFQLVCVRESTRQILS